MSRSLQEIVKSVLKLTNIYAELTGYDIVKSAAAVSKLLDDAKKAIEKTKEEGLVASRPAVIESFRIKQKLIRSAISALHSDEYKEYDVPLNDENGDQETGNCINYLMQLDAICNYIISSGALNIYDENEKSYGIEEYIETLNDLIENIEKIPEKSKADKTNVWMQKNKYVNDIIIPLIEQIKNIIGVDLVKPKLIEEYKHDSKESKLEKEKNYEIKKTNLYKVLEKIYFIINDEESKSKLDEQIKKINDDYQNLDDDASIANSFNYETINDDDLATLINQLGCNNSIVDIAFGEFNAIKSLEGVVGKEGGGAAAPPNVQSLYDNASEKISKEKDKINFNLEENEKRLNDLKDRKRSLTDPKQIENTEIQILEQEKITEYHKKMKNLIDQQAGFWQLVHDNLGADIKEEVYEKIVDQYETIKQIKKSLLRSTYNIKATSVTLANQLGKLNTDDYNALKDAKDANGVKVLTEQQIEKIKIMSNFFIEARTNPSRYPGELVSYFKSAFQNFIENIRNRKFENISKEISDAFEFYTKAKEESTDLYKKRKLKHSEETTYRDAVSRLADALFEKSKIEKSTIPVDDVTIIRNNKEIGERLSFIKETDPSNIRDKYIKNEFISIQQKATEDPINAVNKLKIKFTDPLSIMQTSSDLIMRNYAHCSEAAAKGRSYLIDMAAQDRVNFDKFLNDLESALGKGNLNLSNIKKDIFVTWFSMYGINTVILELSKIKHKLSRESIPQIAREFATKELEKEQPRTEEEIREWLKQKSTIKERSETADIESRKVTEDQPWFGKVTQFNKELGKITSQIEPLKERLELEEARPQKNDVEIRRIRAEIERLENIKKYYETELERLKNDIKAVRSGMLQGLLPSPISLISREFPELQKERTEKEIETEGKLVIVKVLKSFLTKMNTEDPGIETITAETTEGLANNKKTIIEILTKNGGKSYGTYGEEAAGQYIKSNTIQKIFTIVKEQKIEDKLNGSNKKKYSELIEDEEFRSAIDALAALEFITTKEELSNKVIDYKSRLVSWYHYMINNQRDLTPVYLNQEREEKFAEKEQQKDTKKPVEEPTIPTSAKREAGKERARQRAEDIKKALTPTTPVPTAKPEPTQPVVKEKEEQPLPVQDISKIKEIIDRTVSNKQKEIDSARLAAEKDPKKKVTPMHIAIAKTIAKQNIFKELRIKAESEISAEASSYLTEAIKRIK